MIHRTNNIFIFLWFLVRTLSFTGALNKIKSYYSKEDVKFNFLGYKLFLTYSHSESKKYLSKRMQGELTFSNSIFFDSHYCKYGIGNLHDSVTWQIIHNNLLHSINIENMTNLMDEHKNILLCSCSKECSAQKSLENFLIPVWAKYCFGKDVDVEKYMATKQRVRTLLGKTFYNNWTNSIPYLGSWVCKTKRWLSCKEFSILSTEIESLIDSATEDSFIGKFKTSCEQMPEAPKVVHDNTFLSFLVYDFLFHWANEATLQFARDKIDDSRDRTYCGPYILEKAFLYPYRVRKVGVKEYAIINMVSSYLPFSYGPRTCVGQGLALKFYDNFCDIYSNFKLRLHDKNQNIEYSTNPNVPSIMSEYFLRLDVKADKFTTIVPSFDFKNGVDKFYRIESLMEDPAIYRCITQKMCKYLSVEKVDGIATSEARGFLFAAPVANMTNLPLYTLRKSKKIAGPVHSITYNTAYSSDTLEISQLCSVKGKNLVIIDDGIASGGTIMAMHDLLTRCGANILFVIVAVKHIYVKNNYNKTKIFSVFSQ